ncbi:hypothetical protein M413DRAFT_383142 [Hebeloma cylindrosporum]|uniref:Uncharacterized protein n=1 Tax=Hebeloma cylindrosporum TaxID=76867 RepID=A0A0C3C3S1_HEBCY|nr:hypothetical protein M413DRAFT_383142 [Hebeloma cylindrosporum h7]
MWMVIEERLGCDEGTWVCLRELSPAPLDMDPSMMQRDREVSITPIARSLKGISRGLDSEELSGKALRLHLDGGVLNGIPQNVVIKFSCSDNNKLVFIGEIAGEHKFVWDTPHACLSRDATGSRKLVSVMQDDAEGPVPEDEGKEEGDDELLPNNSRNTMRKWIAIILVVIVTSLFCGYIASSSRARHFTSAKLKGASYAVLPFFTQVYVKLRPIGQSISHFASNSIVRLGTRFRQGDSQLVRWAQEDMALDNAGDLMVNGEGAYDLYDAGGEGWNGMDEYIPLTISPKYGKGRRVRSYGATPDVETFEERGLMNGIGRIFRR